MKTILPLLILSCAPLWAGTPYKELVIQGQPKREGYAGIYDPSLAWGPKAGWLAYSMVNEPGRVDTHIATSVDGGRTWHHVREVNRSEAGSVVGDGGKKIQGVWRHEVACLVYDPKDKGKEWKLFWHKYFARPPYYGKDARMFQYGWIAYRHAASPAGPWSKEIALFGGMMPLQAARYPVKQDLNRLHPDLKRVLTYTEPGALVVGGTLYLSFSAATGNHRTDRTILISSTDHGRTWSYRGTLMTHQDAVALGVQHLTASSLVGVGETKYLLSSPVVTHPILKAAVYRGLYVFELQDLQRARLKRGEDGKLDVVKQLAPHRADAFHSGAGTYDPSNTAGGILLGEVRFEGRPARPFFRIFKTGLNP